MTDTKEKKTITIPLPSGNKIQLLLTVLLVAASFFIGSLWTKVQYLEKGATLGSTNSQAAVTNPQAAAPNAAAGNAVPLSYGSADQVKKLQNDDHVKGDRNARILLIEYSDIECPFCKRFHETPQQLIDAYKGKVAWVYRHFPLSFHANAQKEAEATECANDQGGNDAFWKYLDTLFERTTSNGTGFAFDKMVPLANELGLNEAVFKDCLDSGKYADHVKNDIDEGTKAGVTGTPGNILLDTKTGKTKLIPGALPFEQFKTEIDIMLKES